MATVGNEAIPSREESLVCSDFRVISRLSPPRTICIDCVGHGGPLSATGQKLTVKVQNWLPKSCRSSFIVPGSCL